MLYRGSSHLQNECITSRHTSAFKHLGYLADACDCTSAALRVMQAHPNDCRHRESHERAIDFRMIASDHTGFLQFPYAFADCRGSQSHALPELVIRDPPVFL